MRTLLTCLLTLLGLTSPSLTQEAPSDDTIGAVAAQPFGEANPNLDSAATGAWWDTIPMLGKRTRDFVEGAGLMADHDNSVAFALYTHDAGVLKVSAQLYPLRPGAAKQATLEVLRDQVWHEVGREDVVYPGWSAHFRVESWDGSKTLPYRVRHGASGVFTGSIRRDPVDTNSITVGVLSCNGSHDSKTNPHALTVQNLKALDPDLLFFAGDQHYRHTQHTAGWIDFGVRFRDVLRDRPTITIPDDHDVGQNNLWGAGGTRCTNANGNDGGFLYPPSYVNMVERQQTWHLPDPADASPVGEGYRSYFTRLRLGGIDFAILEDRKFKSGPKGTIPQMGPRPDHINDPKYDPKAIDVEGLVLLGNGQLEFLDDWSADWTGGSQLKAVLSQSAFCGAVHLHGTPDNFLLADLDCNGWPQTGRNAALRRLQAVRAVHLCGDQHLAVVLKHGIEGAHDGPFAFTSPALFNSVYGRWWKPQDEKPGAEPVEGSPLAWTGNFLDGLGNPFRMLAYANPSFAPKRSAKVRADGFGVARFDKQARMVTFECWSRFADVTKDAQFAGWPITVSMDDNDTREPVAWLPEFEFSLPNIVVQVRKLPGGEIVHARRVQGTTVRLPVFEPGEYVVLQGRGVATTEFWRGSATTEALDAIQINVGDF
jgi:hypothetical protein